MGCVHTHWRGPTIEGCGNLSRVWSNVEKIGENNQRVKKISQIIIQVLASRLKHNKIQALWASSIPSNNMLKRVWWCKHSKMKSWRWTICCRMSCSKRGRHACARGSRRSHVALRCCWKRKVLLSTHIKASKRKGCWSTMNLVAMIKATRTQFLK
jgi:hypothetical protein